MLDRATQREWILGLIAVAIVRGTLFLNIFSLVLVAWINNT